MGGTGTSGSGFCFSGWGCFSASLTGFLSFFFSCFFFSSRLRASSGLSGVARGGGGVSSTAGRSGGSS